MGEKFTGIFIGLLLFAMGTFLKAGAGEPNPSCKNPDVVSGEPKYTWHKCAVADGISVYWCKVAGNPVVAFRGEGIVDAPLDKVASVIADTSRGSEWVSNLVESRVLRSVSPGEFIEYDHMGIPFPFTAVVSDRDFVSQVRLESGSKGSPLVISYKSVEDPLAPVLGKYVRGNLMKCVFKLSPMTFPDQTYVEAEFHCDPKGSLSKWMVNFFQEKWPLVTFQNLRKEVKKQDIQVLPVIQAMLRAQPASSSPNN
jgi:hypothetical protein